MSEFISSLLSQMVLSFVALLSTIGGGDLHGRAINQPALLAPPATQQVSGHGPCMSQQAGAEEACAAARMRWQITLHGPAPKRCSTGCVAS